MALFSSLLPGEARRREAVTPQALAVYAQMTVALIGELFALEAHLRPDEGLNGDPREREGARACEVLGPVQSALDDVLALLGQLATAFEHDERARRVADLAFFGQASLRGHKGRLGAVDPRAARWQALLEASEGLREAMKCLTALERELSAIGGFPSKNHHAFVHLEQSLAVRRAYARFRARVRSAHAQADDELRSAILLAGLALDELVGDPVYEQVRIGDRLALGAFKGRLLDWIASHVFGDGDLRAADRDGHHLLSDLLAFTELLRQVNLRSELVAHDRGLLDRLLALLPEDHAAPPFELYEFLELLRGADDELDRLLEERNVGAPRLRACLQRLRHG